MTFLLAASPGAETSPILQTLSIAVVAGVALVLISRRLQISSISFLLLGGVLLGPEMLGVVRPDSLGKVLPPLISLAVALILFEGGLSLNLEGYKSASSIIRRLLSLGILITWFGTAAVIYLLFADDFGEGTLSLALLASSLVIVTGPTVIAPLLRRIRIRRNLNDILHWEGVLIDPIGVFIAILTFEFVTGLGAGSALTAFALRFVAGIVVGGVVGFLVVHALRHNWIPDGYLNIFIVGVAVGIFAFDDYLVPESGLLGVTVAGLILGWKRPGPLQQIKEFKAEITELLIGALFIVLAAQLEFDNFARFGFEGLLCVLAVMFVIRPANVFACTWGSQLSIKEKLFLSYVAPRGIVAASMASLFGLTLMEAGNENAWFVVTFTFSVIGITVIVQGVTAGMVANLLGLKLEQPTGWLVVGAHPFGRRVAGFLAARAKRDVRLLDLNKRSIAEARDEGLAAAVGDARDPDLPGDLSYRGIGNVLALTDNEELNTLICQRWLPVVGRDHVFRWGTDEPSAEMAREQPGTVVWRNLPKPSLVSSEMAGGAITITNGMAGKTPPSSGRGQLTKLVFADERQVLLDPAGQRREIPDGTEGEVLTLRREAEYLLRSIRPELILRLDETRNREDMFREMIERAVSAEPRLNRKEMLNELTAREKAFPTALGHGIAVPHGYSGDLRARVTVVAQVPGGVPFDAPDGEPVRLAFMIISPKGDPEGHLATMAEIARLVADVEVRERLISAPGPEEVLTLLMAARSTRASGLVETVHR